MKFFDVWPYIGFVLSVGLAVAGVILFIADKTERVTAVLIIGTGILNAATFRMQLRSLRDLEENDRMLRRLEEDTQRLEGR